MKITIVVTLLISTFTLSAQNTFPANGNVGIGITNPVSLLHLHSSNNPTISVGKLNQETNGRSTIAFYASKQGYGNGFSISYLKDSSRDRLTFLDGGLRETFTIENGGNIGIGTKSPNGWKLAVNGKIRAKEVKVETGWADFVFEKNYDLPTLKEVEDHIRERGHLKDIPSAEEVAEHGIFLGEMDSKLLQKIEELTLYTIQQQKELEKLTNRIEKANKENESLKMIQSKFIELQKRLEKLESKTDIK